MTIKHVDRIQDVIEDDLLDEYWQLAKLPFRWLDITTSGESGYTIANRIPRLPPKMSLIFSILGSEASGKDYVGLLAATEWLKDGPKVARPTLEQAESFRNISIDLEMSDWSQPYPAMLVETPGCDPFFAVLVYQYDPHVLILHLVSRNHLDDSVTVASIKSGTIESVLSKVDPALYTEEELQRCLGASVAAQRIALNMCLSLVNFHCKTAPAFPKVLAGDQALAREDSERGRKAKRRVRDAMYRVDFQQETIIRRSAPSDPSCPTGRTVAAHWVRGHWKSQPHGPGSSLRKRILVRPYLVHSDQVIGPLGAIYHDRRGS